MQMQMRGHADYIREELEIRKGLRVQKGKANGRPSGCQSAVLVMQKIRGQVQLVKKEPGACEGMGCRSNGKASGTARRNEILCHFSLPGIRLRLNGGERIMEERKCFLCGRNDPSDPLEHHHIFGAAYRKKSEKYGLAVYLCGNRCHRTGRDAVHRNGDQMRRLRRYGQLKAMQERGWTEDDFRREFGKSYL